MLRTVFALCSLLGSGLAAPVANTTILAARDQWERFPRINLLEYPNHDVHIDTFAAPNGPLETASSMQVIQTEPNRFFRMGLTGPEDEINEQSRIRVRYSTLEGQPAEAAVSCVPVFHVFISRSSVLGCSDYSASAASCPFVAYPG